MSKKIEDMKAMSGLLFLIGALALPIAIGMMAGAGVGWLIFAAVMIAGAYRIKYVTREEEKKRKKEETSE